MSRVQALAEWEEVNGTTRRLEVPGGWLYKVTPGGGHPPVVVLVADPPLSTTLYKMGEALGNGGAASPFGAIEGHSVMLRDGAARVADAISELAGAVRDGS